MTFRELIYLDYKFRQLGKLMDRVREGQQQTTQELITKMADLEQAISDVKDAVTAGFAAITDATTAAADRVIASINAGDTSGAVTQLEGLKGDIAAAASAEVEKLNAIDTAPATPAPDTTGGTPA